MRATAAELVTRLREGRGTDAVDPGTQALFERWARREQWHARSEALALLVGMDPDDWPALAARQPQAADELWDCLAADLDLDATTDPPLPPARVRAWARGAGIVLPAALARLLDFIASVLPTATASAAGEASELEVLRAQERETVLGAALMLVTRQAAECVDDEGYYDPVRIARLVRARSLLWFPLAPPSLDEDEMVRLLSKWLPPGRSGA